MPFLYSEKQESPPILFLGFILCAGALLTALTCQATPSPDYTTFSLEELLAVEITSATKQKQPLRSTAAALTVLTSDDIRRSGATSIPELLRHVPGLEVARIDSNKWAISARGFNWRYANKLLVLIDGRSIYTPLFSGVYWDVQDTMLADIERIEIIRGPGGTLWGANAVNGVINIITKKSSATTGSLATLLTGTQQNIGAARFGGGQGNFTYRVFGKYQDTNSQTNPQYPAYDAWHSSHGGFRSDLHHNDTDFTLQGDIYQSKGHSTKRQILPPNSIDETNDDANGGNLLANYQRQLSTSSALSIKGYFDRTNRDTSAINTGLSTIDLEAQHTCQLGEKHGVIWGAGYRLNRESTTFYSASINLVPQNYNSHISNIFLQDKITLLPETLHLTIGSKVEDNSYTGIEFQPNIRLAWQGQDTTIWGAISRAVRTPSRIEDGQIHTIGNTVVVQGNKDLAAEKLTAYETGLRQSFQQGSLDLALFFNDYDTLICTETINNIITWVDTKNAETYGGELTLRYLPRQNWQLVANYTYLHVRWNIDGPNSSPEHQVNLSANWKITDHLDLDCRYYIVSHIAAYAIPAYNDVDLRLAWQATNELNLELLGQNLLNPSRQEFFGDRYSNILQATENPRTISLRATLLF